MIYNASSNTEFLLHINERVLSDSFGELWPSSQICRHHQLYLDCCHQLLNAIQFQRRLIVEKNVCESMKYGVNTEQWLQKNNKKYSQGIQHNHKNLIKTNVKHKKDQKKLQSQSRKGTEQNKCNTTDSSIPPRFNYFIF